MATFASWGEQEPRHGDSGVERAFPGSDGPPTVATLRARAYRRRETELHRRSSTSDESGCPPPLGSSTTWPTFASRAPRRSSCSEDGSPPGPGSGKVPGDFALPAGDGPPHVVASGAAGACTSSSAVGGRQAMTTLREQRRPKAAARAPGCVGRGRPVRPTAWLPRQPKVALPTASTLSVATAPACDELRSSTAGWPIALETR